jgi:hypothetical protein
VACGEKLPPEDEPDTRRPWPPAHLPEVWFDLESSFELLSASKDALIQECTLNNVRLPGNSCGDEAIIDFDCSVGMSSLEYARKLQSRNATDSLVKNYWRRVASSHLEDLLQYQIEMAFVTAVSVK